ncbi:hypothetical protein BC835DRAFT_1323106 [Cytidiella melzeri]|nr:hypothetical protein BC835DRAFT_1323106 [Cytidiella melzeri]
MDTKDDVIAEQAGNARRSVGSSKEATPPEESTEASVPRKREREVSIEPQTPQASSSELEPHNTDTKDRRAPAKKNRISAQLDSTQEEEEQNGEGAVSLASDQGMSSSPPTESKIRQISQGVEDITWRNMPKAATPEIERTEPDAQYALMDAEQSTAAPEEPVVVPSLMRGENPPLIIDDAGVDEHAGEADPAEVPPSAQPEPTTPIAEHEDATPPPDSVMQSPQKELAGLSRRGSDESVDQDKKLKRKMGDRTVSERRVPEDLLGVGSDSKVVTATKRPRDGDVDLNPRATKRPTPPPEEEPAAGPSSASGRQTPPNSVAQTQATEASGLSTPKSGFMAYASTSSPFASVKGPSLFSSRPWGHSNSSVGSSSASPMVISPAPKLGTSSLPNNTPGSPSPPPTSLKRSGFEAFSTSSSPFGAAAKRSKSPPPPSIFGRRSGSPARHHSPARAGVNPFSAYATGTAHGFSAPAPRGSSSGAASAMPTEDEDDREASTAPTQNGDAEEDSSQTAVFEKEVSFAERLRSQKEEDDVDEEKKLNLTEQEVHTGEEDEVTLYQVRGKLFSLSGSHWTERGTGQLKLNVRQEDGSGARLIMRKEGVYTLMLNATLFSGMKCALAQDPRYIRFSVIENGTTTHYNIRLSNAKIAAELLEEINAQIP